MYQGNSFLVTVRSSISRMKGCNAHLSVLFLMYCWNLRKLFRLMDARRAGVEGAHGKDDDEEEEVVEEEEEVVEEEEEEEEEEE